MADMFQTAFRLIFLRVLQQISKEDIDLEHHGDAGFTKLSQALIFKWEVSPLRHYWLTLSVNVESAIIKAVPYLYFFYESFFFMKEASGKERVQTRFYILASAESLTTQKRNHPFWNYRHCFDDLISFFFLKRSGFAKKIDSYSNQRHPGPKSDACPNTFTSF